MASHHIAVVAFDGISPFHLSLPGIVFGQHREEIGVPKYGYTVCSADGRSLSTNAGYSIEVRNGLGALAKADVVIVPSWRDPAEPPPARLAKALQFAHERGAKVIGLCLGAFVLAGSGLLDARRATTHWRWADLFSSLYPAVTLERDKLYIDEGDVLTSAGNAAGLDCCLHVFRSHHGVEAANKLARRLVIPPHRQGGQAQYIERPMQVDKSGDRLARTMEWARAHPELPHSIESLASRALLSTRTFSRRFQQLTGSSVRQWLIEQRLSIAQRMLETTEATIEEIASAIGFADSLSLRQHFANKLLTTPSNYRKQFRGPPQGQRAGTARRAQGVHAAEPAGRR